MPNEFVTLSEPLATRWADDGLTLSVFDTVSFQRVRVGETLRAVGAGVRLGGWSFWVDR